MGKPDDLVASAFADLGIRDGDVMQTPALPHLIDTSDAAIERRKRERAERDLPDGPVLLPATMLSVESIDWLWPGWLARKKLHILAGAPGQGKTTIAVAIAAALSRGADFPDGARCKPGNVLVWSGEDDPTDTLLPRFLAMGGDPKHLYFVRATRELGEIRAFDPAKDMAGLASNAQEIGGADLVVVDPIVVAVAGDSHKNTEVRRSLQPMVDLAAQLGCAVLGITHFSKGSSGRDPTERVTGSVAFGAVARVVLVAAKVKQAAGDRRVFARAKSNIGPDEGGFAYELQQAGVPGHEGVHAATVRWGEALPGTARELLAEAENADEDDESSGAVEFLRELLADGPLPAKEVRKHADEAGHAWRTVQRAKTKAGVKHRRTGSGSTAATIWSLPDPTEAHSRHSRHVLKAGASGASGASGDTEAF